MDNRLSCIPREKSRVFLRLRKSVPTSLGYMWGFHDILEQKDGMLESEPRMCKCFHEAMDRNNLHLGTLRFGVIIFRAYKIGILFMGTLKFGLIIFGGEIFIF